MNVFYGPLAAVLLLAALPAMAQQAADANSASGVKGVAEALGDSGEAALDPNLYVGIEEAYKHHVKLQKPVSNPAQMKTLFFTAWQHALLQEAKQGFWTRRPEQRELDQDTNMALLPKEQRERGIRELSLGGILYKSSKDWIVWLNGQRVLPDAIPKQVMDIKVHDNYIELKWYDTYNNLVYPVRLRPHQRFNLDSRIFLPGAPAL